MSIIEENQHRNLKFNVKFKFDVTGSTSVKLIWGEIAHKKFKEILDKNTISTIHNT